MKDTFTLWGVQSQDGVLLHSYKTREDARMWCGSLQQVVKLECRIVPQKKPRKLKTFTAHGLEWIPHTPGDPMPCDGRRKVRVLLRDGEELIERSASCYDWKIFKFLKKREIIGWNYAGAK